MPQNWKNHRRRKRRRCAVPSWTPDANLGTVNRLGFHLGAAFVDVLTWAFVPLSWFWFVRHCELLPQKIFHQHGHWFSWYA